MAGLSLVVLPNDPLDKYVAKGELPEGYFNPGGLFGRVHCLSLGASPRDLSETQILFGEAEVIHHALPSPTLFNLFGIKDQAVRIIKEIQPTLIRAYNPLLMGWMGVEAQLATEVPCVISIHNDYRIGHNLFEAEGLSYLPRALYQLGFRLLGLEKKTLSKAAGVFGVYPTAADYAKPHRNQIEVIYNRVDPKVFYPGPEQSGPLRKLISVGRLFKGKDPSCIIESLAALPEDFTLTLVGQGPLKERLVGLALSLDLQDRVQFKDRVNHKNLGDLLRQHDIFVQSLNQTGISKGILEALACKLRVVLCSASGLSDWEGVTCIPKANESSSVWAETLKCLSREKLAQKQVEKLSEENFLRAMLNLKQV